MEIVTNIGNIETKKELRCRAKDLLNGITTENRQISSQKIAIQLITSSIFHKSRAIACYLPIDNEVETPGIIEAIWQNNKQCYLPAITPNQKMVFVEFQPNDLLISKKYQVLEPSIIEDRIIAATDLDLVIIPLLGFNTNFFRLGRGIGYYDRAFAFKKLGAQKPYLLGIGHQTQLLNFEPNDWDVPMDSVMAA